MNIAKYEYIEVTLDVEWKEVSRETKPLDIESRIVAFSEDEYVDNPTGDPDAFFYEIIINSNGKQVQTFHPMEEWFQPMTEDEARERLDAHIAQIVETYHATPVTE